MKKRIIIDTHAHFGVKKNKIFETLRENKEYKVKVFLNDLNHLKKLIEFNKKSFVEDSNLLEDYINCMDKNNIALSWIHQLSFKNILGYEVLSNEQISDAINKYPDKFRGFASVNPHSENKVKELEYAIKTLGLHAFKLNPNDYGGFNLNDKQKLYPLYEKCCELGIPVSVHTGITPGSIFRMKHNYPLLLDDVAVDFPELTIIVEHMGYPWNDLCYYMVSRHENMYITITGIANILIHTKPNVFKIELSKMVSLFGSEKILWGSDWTVTPNINEVLTFLDKINIPLPIKLMMGLNNIKKKDIDNILGLNALRILK